MTCHTTTVPGTRGRVPRWGQLRANAIRKFGVPGKSAGIWLRRRALRAARLTAQRKPRRTRRVRRGVTKWGPAPAVTGRGRCGFPRRRTGSRRSRISAEIRSANFRMALKLGARSVNPLLWVFRGVLYGRSPRVSRLTTTCGVRVLSPLDDSTACTESH
jgi:hypothetical protein